MLLMRVLRAVVICSFMVAVTPNSIGTCPSWGTVAGAFLPVPVRTVLKGTTKAGAWAGFIGGFAVSLGGAII